LDARGVWRMRDERAQSLNLPGDKIRNAALLGFINRNYEHDERGCWYFQNGPQRVYVDLEATPYIAHMTPDAGLLLHTGAALPVVDAVFLSSEGKCLFRSGEILAQLDDRDLAACLGQLRLNSAPVSDDALIAWLENQQEAQTLSIELSAPQSQTISVQRGELSDLMTQLRYVSKPRIN
jgi:hypothetical protein